MATSVPIKVVALLRVSVLVKAVGPDSAVLKVNVVLRTKNSFDKANVVPFPTKTYMFLPAKSAPPVGPATVKSLAAALKLNTPRAPLGPGELKVEVTPFQLLKAETRVLALAAALICESVMLKIPQAMVPAPANAGLVLFWKATPEALAIPFDRAVVPPVKV